MATEGCAPVRRGLLDHFETLGALGVALYVWLILMMDPATRRVETNTEAMREALGTGPNQVSRTLLYLEKRGYIAYMRGNGKNKSIITLLKPNCPTTGTACPLADAEAPCLVLEQAVRDTAKVVRIEEHAAKDAKVRRVFDAWNAAGVIQHRKLTDNMARVVLRAVKAHGEEAITEAIGNYSKVVHDPACWFTYRYTLQDFVSRKGGDNIMRFGNAAQPLVNFRGKTAPAQTTSAGESKYADL